MGTGLKSDFCRGGFLPFQNLLSKPVGIHDCYRWMDVIGGPSRVLDTKALVDLFSLVSLWPLFLFAPALTLP